LNQQEIKEAASEACGVLIGGRIDRIFQLDDYTFVFYLFNHGITHFLLISVMKRSKRFHLLMEEIRKEFLLSANATAILKKYLSKQRITRIILNCNLLEVHTGHEQNRRLLVDFSEYNIKVLDESNHAEFSLYRKDSKNPYNSTGNEKTGAPDPPGGPYHGVICPTNETAISDHHELRVNSALSSEFFSERKEALVKALQRILKTEEKKVLRLAGKLRSEEKDVENKEYYKNVGELIKYNLEVMPRGTGSATLTGFDGNEVEAVLDPRLTPLENMKAYFYKYKKLKKQASVIDRKIQNQEQRLKLIREIQKESAEGESMGLTRDPSLFLSKFDFSPLGSLVIQKIENFYRARGKNKTAPKAPKSALKKRFLEFTSRTGKRILVGRNAGENEELSIRVARGNDLWFHAESGAGSHVILRYEKTGDFQPVDIEDAAVLALYFSKLRGEKKGLVVYTFRKYVKKPKNTKKGTVLYFNNKTRFTALDANVLARLMSHTPQIT
jgi:predicted ribosome quality control (RQC) complex YloA/Tae2 family protein